MEKKIGENTSICSVCGEISPCSCLEKNKKIKDEKISKEMIIKFINKKRKELFYNERFKLNISKDNTIDAYNLNVWIAGIIKDIESGLIEEPDYEKEIELLMKSVHENCNHRDVDHDDFDALYNLHIKAIEQLKENGIKND